MKQETKEKREERLHQKLQEQRILESCENISLAERYYLFIRSCIYAFILFLVIYFDNYYYLLLFTFFIPADNILFGKQKLRDYRAMKKLEKKPKEKQERDS